MKNQTEKNVCFKLIKSFILVNQLLNLIIFLKENIGDVLEFISSFMDLFD